MQKDRAIVVGDLIRLDPEHHGGVDGLAVAKRVDNSHSRC